MRSIDHQIELVHAIDSQTVTSGGGAVNSGDLDRQEAESMEFVFNIGDNGGDTLNGTNHFEVKVEHADDDGTGSADSYAAVSAGEVVVDTDQAPAQDPDSNGVIIDVDDAAEDQASYKFAYIGDKRFVKVTITPQGTLTNGNPMSLTAVKADRTYRT